MRTAIILGIKPDGSSVLLSGPEVPIHEQKARFKKARELSATDPQSLPSEISEMQLWESGSGYTKQLRLTAKPRVVAPAPVQKPAKATKKPAPSPTASPAPDISAHLAALSDDELLKTALELKLDVPADSDRAAIIAAITEASAPKK